MKRLFYISILLTLLFSSCAPVEPVPRDHLSIISGISENKLYIDGAAGSEAHFSIGAKLAWDILSTPGVVYTPSSGEATEHVTITAKATEANNTLAPRRLGDVIIRLAHTRFTGIEAYQRPLISIDQKYLSGITIAPEQNSRSTVEFECKSSDIEIITSGNITCSAPKATATNKYSITITATADNLTAKQSAAGKLSFKVDGVALQGSIDVIQRAAIALNRSRININGTAGATTVVEIDTPFDFNVSSSSSALKATKNSNSSITLTSTEANSTSAERKIAQLTLTLADNPSCKATIDVWQRKQKADHTLLFYLMGTSLKSYYNSNISMVESIVSSGLTENCRVMVFSQSSTSAGQSFEIYYDKGLQKIIHEPLCSYELPAQYDQQMLSTILTDMTAAAPAAEYGLFIGSHGKGWLPKSSIRSALAPFSTEESIWVPVVGAAEVRHIGDSASTQLNTTELAGAIAATGCHLGYIIFDVCYMGNVETAYDLKDVTDYILASPCEVMASGMPYNQTVPCMISTKSIKERLDSAAEAFVDYYQKNSQGAYRSACSVVINCAELEALAAATKVANGSLKSIDPNSVQPYDGVSSSRNPTHIFFDIEDYIIKACTDQGAVDSFKTQLTRTISGQFHTETFYSAYNGKANAIDYYSGLTTSAPIIHSSTSAYIEEWKQTAWYKATH